MADNDVKGSAAADMDRDGSRALRPAKPLEPPATTATTQGMPSLLPSNGELCSQNYSPADGERVRETQGTMAPPGDAAEARTQTCDMGADDAHVDGRCRRAADVARDDDETLFLETGAVELSDGTDAWDCKGQDICCLWRYLQRRREPDKRVNDI